MKIFGASKSGQLIRACEAFSKLKDLFEAPSHISY